MLRIEKKNAESPIEQKPRWIRNQVRTGPGYEDMKSRVAGASLHTVCQEAGCPNIHECWESREATFLIGGDKCTRRCDFCDIATGKPEELDRDEPRRVAENIREMDLNYTTITGVTRDDLPDEGAWLYAEVVRKIHELNPHTGVENLTPDFSGKPDLLEEVFEAKPEVFAHNLETVPRLYKQARPGANYEHSLKLLKDFKARKPDVPSKSGLMVGLGETADDLVAFDPDEFVDALAAKAGALPVGEPSGHVVLGSVIDDSTVQRCNELLDDAVATTAAEVGARATAAVLTALQRHLTAAGVREVSITLTFGDHDVTVPWIRFAGHRLPDTDD